MQKAFWIGTGAGVVAMTAVMAALRITGGDPAGGRGGGESIVVRDLERRLTTAEKNLAEAKETAEAVEKAVVTSTVTDVAVELDRLTCENAALRAQLGHVLVRKPAQADPPKGTTPASCQEVAGFIWNFMDATFDSREKREEALKKMAEDINAIPDKEEALALVKGWLDHPTQLGQQIAIGLLQALEGVDPSEKGRLFMEEIDENSGYVVTVGAIGNYAETARLAGYPSNLLEGLRQIASKDAPDNAMDRGRAFAALALAESGTPDAAQWEAKAFEYARSSGDPVPTYGNIINYAVRSKSHSDALKYFIREQIASDRFGFIPNLARMADNKGYLPALYNALNGADPAQADTIQRAINKIENPTQ